MNWQICEGDARAVLATWPPGSVQCVCTSPPYWGLRSYQTTPQVWGGRDDCAHIWDERTLLRATRDRQHLKELGERLGCGGGTKHSADAEKFNGASSALCRTCGAWRGELGSEPDIDSYVAHLVDVFRAVRRVLAPTGVLWLNIGDSYSNAGRAGSRGTRRGAGKPGWTDGGALGDKQLLLIPARVALALQSDGWFLRSAIVWSKPNAMPESVKDRPTKSYEMVYLFSKQVRYYYDAAAIAEPMAESSAARYGYAFGGAKSEHLLETDQVRTRPIGMREQDGTRNARDVWSISTEPYEGSHFAVMPTELARRCILAGSRPGDSVLDPFSGAGTTVMTALRHGRRGIGIELNPAYVALSRERIVGDSPLFNRQEGAA